MKKERYFVNSQSLNRYYKFSRYLQNRFEQRVHKISVDAGFSCPNREIAPAQGCIFCNNQGFSLNSREAIDLQIKQGIAFNRKRFGAKKFIVYFQSYTNTYANLDILKERYDVVKRFDDIVGISIGTRPDCINEEILDLIDSYTRDYEVWIEYGLQSIHNTTLELINRGHTYEDFLRAILKTRKRERIKVCSHTIIGLPQETEVMIMETAKELGRLKLDGIKIHPLHIIKGTRLEKMFCQGLYKPLEMEEYIDLCTRFLEHLWTETVIQRITADCPKEFLVGPMWILQKGKVLEGIDAKLLMENRFQGRLWE